MHATAFRPPLYPLVLAVPTRIFGGHVLWPARTLSLLLSVGVVVATVAYVGHIADRRAAFASGIAVAVTPSLIANDTVTLTEPLALLLLLGVFIAIARSAFLCAGALTGLLMLTRPNAYLVVCVVGVAAWRAVGWRRALAAGGVAMLVIVPWMVRNEVQVGSLGITTSDGFNLAAIYGPPARSRTHFVDPVSDHWYDGTEYELSQLDEARWNRELTDLAMSGVRQHPGYVIDVVRRNVRAFFELSPSVNRSAEARDGRNLRFRSATLVWFHALTAVGIVGLLMHVRRAVLWPALAIVAQFVVLSLLLVAPPRLRAPFDLLMCVGAGLFVSRLGRGCGRGDRAPDIAGDG